MNPMEIIRYAIPTLLYAIYGYEIGTRLDPVLTVYATVHMVAELALALDVYGTMAWSWAAVVPGAVGMTSQAFFLVRAPSSRGKDTARTIVMVVVAVLAMAPVGAHFLLYSAVAEFALTAYSLIRYVHRDQRESLIILLEVLHAGITINEKEATPWVIGLVTAYHLLLVVVQQLVPRRHAEPVDPVDPVDGVDGVDGSPARHGELGDETNPALNGRELPLQVQVI